MENSTTLSNNESSVMSDDKKIFKGNCFKSCLVLSFKLAALAIFRFLIHEFNLIENLDIQKNGLLNFGLMILYLTIILLVGNFYQHINPIGLILLNNIIIAIEMFFVTSTEYSSMMMYLLSSVASYIFLIGLFNLTLK